jgi:predicted DNA-binding transcriptional regulator AlpA
MKTKTKTRTRKTIDRSGLPATLDAALDTKDVCAALKISRRKFAEMLSTGEFPKHDLRLGALNRWRVSTFNAWMASQCEGAKGG